MVPDQDHDIEEVPYKHRGYYAADLVLESILSVVEAVREHP